MQVKVREQESHRSTRGDFNIYCIDIIKYNKYVYLYRTVSVHDLFKAKVIVKVNYDEGGWWLQVEMFSAQSATSLAKCYFVIIFEA